MIWNSDLTEGHAPPPSLPPAFFCQFWVPLVEAALFRHTKPRVARLTAQHMVKLAVKPRASWTALSKVVTSQSLLPKDAFGCPEGPSSQGQLQADSTAGPGCHEGCGNGLNTMTTGSLDGNLVEWKVAWGGSKMTFKVPYNPSHAMIL